jgi:uncharacterized protein YbjT (DUF2867 family)
VTTPEIPRLPPDHMSRLLVLGGTGFVGRSVCEQLVARNGGAAGRITVPSRRPQRAAHLRSLPTLEVVPGNIHNDAELVRLVSGCDAVINLVAVLHGSEAEFQKTHVELPRRLASACKAAGVQRVVHVSALGVGLDNSGREPSRYLRSKAAGERVLKDAHLDLTLLRPSVIFGEHDKFINLFAQMQGVLPFVPLAGEQARFQPVWVEDVARAIVACLDQPASIGETIECAGPTVYTLGDLVRRAGHWAGHERPVFGIPEFAARLQARAMELMPGTPLMSRDNLDSMKTPNTANAGMAGLDSLGIHASAMESVMPGVLGKRSGIARLDPLRREQHRG